MADGDAGDQFVRSSPDGTIFHLTTWKRVVEEVFQHTPHYLLAAEGSEIRGVLPLFEIWGLLAGHILISVPYGIYGAALPAAFSLAVNDFMYWELMRESCLAGYRVFDFGQNHPGSGTYNFKRHWGFEPKPLAYQYMLINGRGIPHIGSSNPRLRPFIEAWKCLPLSVTKWVGPALTRRLPLH